ncbi:MAG: MOSC domain-containing protein [Anaerolineales bacterium]|uniref:MOSC domain-containing protein n=1 Tax=Candidatus Desulfolinea nitratireducens TaxID=2841698 RepID=A0A8J6TEZ5_9CHLR|nr:MOSC domain-containing protein [Candidatus Desulfolinea nitratireducens]MBL6961966.1 MOSC domain-containing protein [Anaerolineales bacterium]
MVENIRELGRVKLVQLQPSGLIIETPSGDYYDVSRRVEVDRIQITSNGIEATTPDGEHVLDIHHLDHPDKAYDDDDLVCIGFTSHYEAMRKKFGDHMVDGSAGENIIIEYDQEVWEEDIGQQLAIENMESGERMLLEFVSYATPCAEFSHFAADSQDMPLEKEKLKETLQFLHKGRRGFLLVMRGDQQTAIVQAGDRVFAIHE